MRKLIGERNLTELEKKVFRELGIKQNKIPIYNSKEDKE